MFREVFEPERGQRVPVRIWARQITEVLDDQEDLVKRQVRLEPIGVLKG